MAVMSMSQFNTYGRPGGYRPPSSGYTTTRPNTAAETAAWNAANPAVVVPKTKAVAPAAVAPKESNVSSEALAALQRAIAQYGPGGGFGSGVEAGLERGRVQATTSGMQNLVSAGLAGTTMAAGLGKKYEEEVAAPARANVESVRAEKLSGLETMLAQMEQGGSQAGLDRSFQASEASLNRGFQAGESALNRLTQQVIQPSYSSGGDGQGYSEPMTPTVQTPSVTSDTDWWDKTFGSGSQVGTAAATVYSKPASTPQSTASQSPYEVSKSIFTKSLPSTWQSLPALGGEGYTSPGSNFIIMNGIRYVQDAEGQWKRAS